MNKKKEPHWVSRRVERHGTITWEDPVMDATRKTNCLCLRCGRLNTTDPKLNCPMAAVLFALCQTKGMAMGISRCAEWIPREEGV